MGGAGFALDPAVESVPPPGADARLSCVAEDIRTAAVGPFEVVPLTTDGVVAVLGAGGLAGVRRAGAVGRGLVSKRAEARGAARSSTPHEFSSSSSAVIASAW